MCMIKRGYDLPASELYLSHGRKLEADSQTLPRINIPVIPSDYCKVKLYSVEIILCSHMNIFFQPYFLVHAIRLISPIN